MSPLIKKDGSDRPHLAWALKLTCIYCGETPLQARRSWFVFAQGCKACDYRFERELGYYMGASWMVTFPVISLVGFLEAALWMCYLPHGEALWVAAITSICMVLFGIWFTPYGMALWMYGEHRLHPLHAEDAWDKELLQ